MCPQHGRVNSHETTYKPRFADVELSALLDAVGAVLIEGPRACGKTFTASQVARSEVRLDVDTAARRLAEVAPELLLEGPRPRLIDEWQLVDTIWDHVRRAVDDAQRSGLFILTGSAVAPSNVSRHSGAGRIARLRMRPMSLAESGHSQGSVSLRQLMDGERPTSAPAELTIRDIADRIVIGGWPRLVDSTPDRARLALRAYLDETRRVDLQRIDNVERDPEGIGRVIRSVARHVSTAASVRSITADVVGAENAAVKPHTVADYMEALRKAFVLEDLEAWSPSLRSRSRLRQSPVRHFVDPSLACAALNVAPTRLLQDVETLGLLFESLVVRDLRIYAQTLEASLYHYHDNSGLEADAVVELPDGRWAAFEVKLGQQQIDDAARHLLTLAERIDTDRHGTPAALCVVTGWGYAYPRPDGVQVVPIGCLAA